MDRKQIILQNDIQQVPLLAQFVDEVCEAAGIDMATAMKLNLAIEEAVVNVMNYAYPQDTVGDIKIEARGTIICWSLSSATLALPSTLRQRPRLTPHLVQRSAL